MSKYSQSYTSGGKQTTSGANTAIDFYVQGKNSKVTFLSFQTFATACHIKLNGEDTQHWIDANSELIIQDMDIDKIVIVESGIEYYYTAFGE